MEPDPKDFDNAKQFMEEESKNPLSAYASAFDLAADCTSHYSLWNDDMSIPQWIVELAETFLPDVYALEPTLGELEAAHRTEPHYACKQCGKPGGH